MRVIVGKLALALAILVGGSPAAVGQVGGAVHGLLDLRGLDWEAQPMVELGGTWRWQGSTAAEVAVPGDLQDQHVPDRMGTYALTVLLPPGRPDDLAIEVPEVLTAYALSLNGRPLGGRGVVSADIATARPAYGRRLFLVPQGSDTLRIDIETSNHHHRRSGILRSPSIGRVEALTARHDRSLMLGYILVGLMLMSGIYQLLLFLNRRRESMQLWHAVFCLIFSIHFLCLNGRWLYMLAGEDGWAWIYRLELSTMLAGLVICSQFVWDFFQGFYSVWIHRTVIALGLALVTFALVTPIRVGGELDRVLPLASLVIIVYCGVVLIVAMRRRMEGALPMIFAVLVEVAALFADGILFGRHVDSILLAHYLSPLFALSIGWVISRRIAQSHARITQLGEDLEKAIQALESQNLHLEREIAARTSELVATRDHAHRLEMEQKRRDLETLRANNQMKLQLTHNLIGELQRLLQAEADQQGGLRRLVVNLRNQVATEEKLQVLQNEPEVVNAEFYSRLSQRFPELSKTEREICAYMKLNLTSKDIATLRQTSLNTINVARHRIRRKLGLERDDELEAYVQQL